MVGAWQTWMDEWVSVCEREEGICWIVGMKQVLGDAYGGNSVSLCVSLACFNLERYRRYLVLSSTEAQESRRQQPLQAGW